MCRFIAKMASEGLKHRTTKSYMAGIRYFQVEEGLGDRFLPTLPRLHYMLRGVKWSQGKEGATGRECLPITPNESRQSGIPKPMTWTLPCFGPAVWHFSASIVPVSLRCHVSRGLTYLPICHGATWQWMFWDSPVR